MTYSRPGIGRVNVGAGGSGGNTPSIIGSSKTSVTANAPFRDKRDPAQAAKNVDVKYQGINALLDFANSKETRKFVADQIDRQAKKDASAVVDSYSPTDITAGGNAEAVDAYNNLSGRAKDEVIQMNAAKSVNSYGPALAARATSDPLLKMPATTPQVAEQQALRLAQIKAEVGDETGYSAIPAFTKMQYADDVAAAEASVKGALYKTRQSAQADLNFDSLSSALAVEFGKAYEVPENAASSNPEGIDNSWAQRRAGLEAAMRASGDVVDPRRQALALAAGLGRTLSETSNGAQKLQIAEAYLAQTSEKLYGIDGETNLWDITIDKESRVSLKQGLEALVEQSKEDADEWNANQLIAEISALPRDQQQGAWLQNMHRFTDKKYWVSILPAVNSLQKVSSEAQLQNDNTLKQQLIQGKISIDDAGLKVLQSAQNYSQGFVDDITRRALSNRERDKEYQDPALKRWNSLDDDSDYDDLREQFDNAVINSLGSDATEEQGVTAKSQYRLSVRDAYTKLEAEAEAANPGKPIDKERIYIESLKQGLSDFKAKYGQDGDKQADAEAAAALTPDKEFAAYAETVATQVTQATRQNGGRFTIPKSAIRPDVFKKWQERNPRKTWDMLSFPQKQQELVRSVQTIKGPDGKFYTPQQATAQVRKWLKTARENAKTAGSLEAPDRAPSTVPVTEAEENSTERPPTPAQKWATKVLDGAVDYIQEDLKRESGPPAYEFIRKWFNGGGSGPQSMQYVDSFLNMVAGVQPSYARERGLENGTPEGLVALRKAWQGGQQGMKTGPLPQVPADAPARYTTIAINNDQHELFVMIGVSEGTRTASGGYTKAYYGHTDIGDGNLNRGTVSGGRGTNASPQQVDQKWMNQLTRLQTKVRPALLAYGLKPGTQGFNRTMFNILDLYVQSPLAAEGLIKNLRPIAQQGFTIEAIAKARADSYFNPGTGRLEAGGFGNSYQRLFQDQRSRAGVYDYRRRL